MSTVRIEELAFELKKLAGGFAAFISTSFDGAARLMALADGLVDRLVESKLQDLPRLPITQHREDGDVVDQFEFELRFVFEVDDAGHARLKRREHGR
jgi:hypothetical protein